MTSTVQFIGSIHHVGQTQWEALSTTDNPFLRFEFLAALEDCQCIDSDSSETKQALNSGWSPNYVLLKAQGNKNKELDNKQILAIAPVYKKLHSYGEYVFDWAWAEAYQQHGLSYYPKLVWAIPFTPSTGPRIISQGSQQQRALYHQQIAQGLTEYCLRNQISGWHCLFPDSQTNTNLNKGNENNQTMQRISCQFHWFNNNFNNFSHYLDKFTSRKRKNIKKERSKLVEAGFTFSTKVADQVTAEDIENFYRCYQLTYKKRNMTGYLCLNFFQQILQTMSDQIVLVQAQYQNRIVANALYFKDSNNLYGRYWGCLEEFDSLHFECCYYQGIEYCIEHGINHFDPGTQGEHKISRGFAPTICYSQHWIAHPQFNQAINNFLNEEKQHIQHYINKTTQQLPFKN